MSFEVDDFTAASPYFKPDEHKDAVAFLLEVRNFRAQVPSAKFGPKDTIDADVTVFDTGSELAAGKPSKVMPGAIIQQRVLVSNLRDKVGKNLIVKLTKLPPRDGNQAAWAWEKVSADVQQAVIAYGNAREAAKQAAVASAPDFD